MFSGQGFGIEILEIQRLRENFLKTNSRLLQTTFEDQGLGRGPLMSFPSLLGPGGGRWEGVKIRIKIA